jgi:hypothetical protein
MLSDDPLAILQRPRRPEFSPACIQGQVIVAVQMLGLNGESPFASESSACPRLPCRRARRGPCSEGEGVASTPLQETVFSSIGWSQCSHRTDDTSLRS